MVLSYRKKYHLRASEIFFMWPSNTEMSCLAEGLKKREGRRRVRERKKGQNMDFKRINVWSLLLMICTMETEIARI